MQRCDRLGMPLNKRQYTLLMQLVNDKRCFDRRDNTFLLSNRKLGERLGVSASKVDQLFRVLKGEGLVKDVVVSYVNTTPVRMLSPRFLWISYVKTDRYYYSVLYELGCVVSADQWRRTCRDVGGYVNLVTGEVDTSFNWHYIDEMASRYTCWDKCYRKGGPRFRSNFDAQDFQLIESDCEELTQSDQDWFDMVNSGRGYDDTDK